MNISRYNLKRFSILNTKSMILPSGEYTAILYTSNSTVVRDDQEILQLIWVISSGKYASEFFHSYFNMSNNGSLNVFYKMVQNMGFTPEKINYVHELHDSECRLIIKQFDHPLHGASNKVEKYLPVLNITNCESISSNMVVSV